MTRGAIERGLQSTGWRGSEQGGLQPLIGDSRTKEDKAGRALNVRASMFRATGFNALDVCLAPAKHTNPTSIWVVFTLVLHQVKGDGKGWKRYSGCWPTQEVAQEVGLHRPSGPAQPMGSSSSLTRALICSPPIILASQSGRNVCINSLMHPPSTFQLFLTWSSPCHLLIFDPCNP
jgi:hypothetical protein